MLQIIGNTLYFKRGTLTKEEEKILRDWTDKIYPKSLIKYLLPCKKKICILKEDEVPPQS